MKRHPLNSSPSPAQANLCPAKLCGLLCLASLCISIPTNQIGAQTQSSDPSSQGSLTSELKQGWKQYLEDLGDFQATYMTSFASSTTGPNPGYAEIVVSKLDDDHVSVRNNGTQQVDDKEIARTQLVKWTVARNRKYCFELRPVNPEENTWTLLGCESIHIDGQETGLYKLVRNRIDVLVGNLLPGIPRYPLPTLVHEQEDRNEFEAKPSGASNDSDSENAIPIEIRLLEHMPHPYVAKNVTYDLYLVTGTVWVDQSKYRLPLKYDVQMKLLNKIGGEPLMHGRQTGTVTWSRERNIPLMQELDVRSFVTSMDKNSAETQHTIVKSFDDNPELTEADFRLPAFGLPEPPEFARRAWWPYAVLALAGLVLIAIALKWNQQRRANG